MAGYHERLAILGGHNEAEDLTSVPDERPKSKSREVDPVKRRDIIAGLVLAAVSSAAEEHDTSRSVFPGPS